MSGPLHPAAVRCVQRGIFEGLRTFTDLELRISALPADKERGDALEVFAEAYLATQSLVQATQVWPLDSIPLEIQQKLSLDTPRDFGVDGLFETSADGFHAYQVKFRSGRPALTWQELSTFMGLTDQVTRRVLLTNCDDLPKVMNARSNFYCIRGSDLDRLQPSDFKDILGWLRLGVVRPTKKEPLPHQQGALHAILSSIARHDRVTTVMACGTGKTLVQLWVAERMGCRTILVLVPSLALLRQTLHEWLKETRWEGISYLCVCSDPTVDRGMDDLIVLQSDLDFPVTTDSEPVRQFLSREFEGVRVLFSTYQSARVVAAGMAPQDAFDLAIFDEAHRTAGREGVHFSFALKDENLHARKRLFLTATPRHYDVERKDKGGDSRLVYSMDRPEVYGPIVHTLSFAEAARRGIICNYKVLISVVTSEMVNDELLRRGEVVVDGGPVKARHVANQIALQKAVERYGMRKIITFHRSVASAASFTASDGTGIRHHLPKYEAYHVNGNMPTAARERFMAAFREANRGLMSNARCLTEGVDVPAVDMVAFLAPKRSRVDIVQATGRTMRTAPGKTTGYILLPLFLERLTGESIEEAVDRAEFDEVWAVLQAMQEQDEPLADIIRQMREEQGRTGGFDDSRFREKVEVLGPELSLEFLREAIATQCLDRLGSTWDESYGKLKAFKERYGHCNVPHDWPTLGTWVHNQRTKRDRLSPDRILRLDELGFLWDPREAHWEDMFTALEAYKQVHGHCNVPDGWAENSILGNWVGTQRQSKRNGQLSEDRIRRLDGLGFVWDALEASWGEMFATLVAYRRAHGHCSVPRGSADTAKLSSWVSHQREFKKRGYLSPDRIRLLDEIGLPWEPHDERWEKMFAALVAYKQDHGNCNVLRGSADAKLSNWVNTQRALRTRGKLFGACMRRLEEIGFLWHPKSTFWEDMFAALVAYKQTYGHCSVPQNWAEMPNLGTWVDTQRQSKRNGRLPEEHLRRLNEIGLVWDPREAHWEEMFAALAEYKRIHRHCNVPHGWGKNPMLGRWVGKQRSRKNGLPPDRMRRLDEIGFDWNPKANPRIPHSNPAGY